MYEDLSIDFGRTNFLQNRDMACKLGCGLFLSPQLNIRSRKEEGAGRGGMFICTKLRQNLSEIQDRTLERIQKVIWDHLLAFKGEIIQKQALFLLPF